MTDLIEKFHTVAEQSGTTPGLLFEQTVRKVYEAWLHEGDFAVDVGAHKGAHLFPMADAVGPKGTIYGFEPIKKLYENLKKDTKKRKKRTIKLFNLALSNTTGQASFHYFENRPAFSGLQKRHAPFDDEEGGLIKVRVKQTILDSKLPLFKKVSAIKLDIEGGELHALMGAKKCLQKSRPMVVFESGRQASAHVYNYTPEDFFGFFESVGMQVFWLSGGRFTIDEWRINRRCWEFVALPAENAEFATCLPDLCRAVLHNSA